MYKLAYTNISLSTEGLRSEYCNPERQYSNIKNYSKVRPAASYFRAFTFPIMTPIDVS